MFSSFHFSRINFILIYSNFFSFWIFFFLLLNTKHPVVFRWIKMISLIQHSLHVSSLGWPLLSPFAWPMKMAITKANPDTTRARNAGWNRPFKKLCTWWGGRRAEPILLADCLSALLRANQRWGSYCHAHRCYFSPLVLNRQANLHIMSMK